MSRPVVLGCLFLAACEPVLLAADEDKGVGGHQAQKRAADDAGSEPLPGTDAAALSGGEPSAVGAASMPPSVETDAASPQAQLSIKSAYCGSCYDLVANGTGGVPPYLYEWDNGARSQTRRACVTGSELPIWVIVQDSTGTRSNAYVTRLQANAEDAAACIGSGSSTDSVPMCLMNGSFEGTAAINSGTAFDAVPWTTCRAPSDDAGNTPDIANATLDPTMSGAAPEPTDGLTYVAMTTNEQVSQQLCQPLNAGDKTFLKLDARFIQLGGTDMYLQIWGGTSSDCTARRLLWVSPKLTTDWAHYCAPLQPGEYMDMITVRADQPMTALLNVVAVDNLQPVDSCP